MKRKKQDAEEILGVLSSIRRSIALIARHLPRLSEDGRVTPREGLPVETEEDLEWAAVAEAVESLRSDVEALIEQKHAHLMEQALTIYYAAEELTRHPEHADLIPYVERMREAYERDHGRRIPPRKE